MTPPRASRAFLALLLLTACGGSGGGPTGPAGSGSLSATIDGTAWASDGPLLQGINHNNAGQYPMYGAKLAGGNNITWVQLNLTNIPGPGTYPLGTGGNVSGGTASTGVGSASWTTELSGAAGTITLSTLTATRAAGTFSFTAKPVNGTGAAGTKTVTNGQFDFPVTSTANLPAVAEAAKSKVSALLGGTPWNAATVVAAAPSGGVLSIFAGNTVLTITIAITPFGGAAGTFPLLSGNFNRVLTTPGTDPTALCCWGGMSAIVGGTLTLLDSGNITITSISATRVQGTFSAVLAPKTGFAATSNLTITQGSFDVGFP